MSVIAPTLPTPGDPRGGEETDVRNALVAILQLVNGGLDAANITPDAITAALIAAGAVGLPELAATPQVLANKVSKSLVHNTETAIDFDGTDVFDTATMHDPASNNTRLTVPAGGDGLYDMYASINLNSVVAGIETRIGFRKNGATVMHTWTSNETVGTSNFGDVEHQTSFPASLVAGDYIELLVTQYDASSTTRGLLEPPRRLVLPWQGELGRRPPALDHGPAFRSPVKVRWCKPVGRTRARC